MKRFLLFSSLLLSAVMLLCACSSVFQALGIDTHNYESEEVIATHSDDSEAAEEVRSLLSMLLLDTTDLAPFSGATEAMESYRDAVLNTMLVNQYSKFTGDLELLDAATESYPQMQFAALIPADDFSSTVYTAFGGKEKVTNTSGKLFVYLEKVNAYAAVTQPQVTDISVDILSLEETKNTYRVRFCCQLGDERSPEYFALLVKREEGSPFYKYLKLVDAE